MKTNFKTTSIRAAMFLTLTSPALPRGMNHFSHQAPAAQEHTKAAPARSGGSPQSSANHPAPQAPRTQSPAMPTGAMTTNHPQTSVKTGTPATKGTATAGNTTATKSPSTLTNGPAKTTTNTGTTKTPTTNTTSTNTASTNSITKNPPTTNVNINKNINVNRNTNANGFNPGTRQGIGNQSNNGPQRTASNFNSNTNINVNRNTNLGRSGGGIPMGRERAPRIEEAHFQSHFGRAHEFHVQPQIVGGRPWFNFSGVSFALGTPWPAGWLYSDPVYVDSIGGSYVLCNRRYPGVMVPMDVTACTACSQPPVMAASAVATNADCPNCTASAPVEQPDSSSDGVPTVTPGQTPAQVVAILGMPKDIVNMGMRQIYLYDDMRVTFLGGRLTDVR